MNKHWRHLLISSLSLDGFIMQQHPFHPYTISAVWQWLCILNWRNGCCLSCNQQTHQFCFFFISSSSFFIFFLFILNNAFSFSTSQSYNGLFYLKRSTLPVVCKTAAYLNFCLKNKWNITCLKKRDSFAQKEVERHSLTFIILLYWSIWSY